MDNKHFRDFKFKHLQIDNLCSWFVRRGWRDGNNRNFARWYNLDTQKYGINFQ